jgi:hypothetical protein
MEMEQIKGGPLCGLSRPTIFLGFIIDLVLRVLSGRMGFIVRALPGVSCSQILAGF